MPAVQIHRDIEKMLKTRELAVYFPLVVQYIAPLHTTRRYRRDLLTRETKEEFLDLLDELEKARI